MRDAEARKGFTFSRAECYGLADFSRAQLTNSDFNGTVFKKPARFKEVLFHEASDFVGTKFSSEATFTQAKFYGNSDFNDAEFDSGAFFAHSHFQGDAWFKEAKFLGEALFDSAIFARSVHFMQTRFSSFTSFGECRFHVASFAAVRAESAFDLTNAHFDEVPNFNQAHFLEAPRLDNISVPTVPEVRSAKVPVGPDFAARYRALKRLAIQSHDHDRELQFFADELRSQRGDPWSARSLFIAAYRILSDFGRSITRPLLWWIGTTALFAGIYAGLHNSEPSSPLCQGSKSDSLAIYLSLRRGLVLPALGQGQELDRVYGCLFGTAKLTAESGERVISNIPDIAAYAGIVQTLFSTY
jgi:hypothetical protein